MRHAAGTPPRPRLAAAALAAALARCAAGADRDASPEASDAALPSDALAVDAAEDAAVATDAGSDASPDALDAADASRDAPPSDAPDAPPLDVAPPPARYPADRTHSPLTESVARAVRAIARRGPGMDDRVFAKVGASNTVNTNFVTCFAGANVDVAGRADLPPVIAHFRAGDAAGTDPYRRVSLAARVGWSAWAVLAGTPPPLAQEVDAIRPRYAVVMFGTNDIQSRDIVRYGENLLDIADALAARGVVPVFSSVPPRDDDPAADAWVPRYAAVARGVAEARQVPFVDLHRELRALPGHGLGPDGIHMNAYTVAGAARPCVFTAAGLGFGFNVRNLLTLQALARLRAVAADGAVAPDGPTAQLAGEGTAASPYVIDRLPFTDLRDTRTGGTRALDRYAGCMAAQDESGPEYVYRFTTTRQVRVRAIAIDRGGTDIDVHLLGAAARGEACVARDDRMLVATLAPGTHHFALDTFVASGVARAGEYLFVLVEE